MFELEDIKIGDSYVIRGARRTDCERIHQLVKDLADDLGAPKNTPKVDAKNLEINGFDTTPPKFKCLVVEYTNDKQNLTNGTNSQSNSNLIGYAFTSFTFSSWYGHELYLEDIYLEKEHQGKGIGARLFDAVVEIAVKNNCTTMNFLVVDGNPVNEFYMRRGAVDQTIENKFHYCSIRSEQLEKLYQKHLSGTESSVDK
ncbi:diamine acetyltransferase 1-like isoform X1 [Nilaparvata lugens]|uniref:diamine acetyltransferase 1-like isoform X1 n=1 Tax=Nilaparvata lugens TaxID=108931 RepID=UPI00193C9CAE|nr:diamine acetyltransferase 1-like isoform X1 [Nilaparvata lugens]